MTIDKEPFTLMEYIRNNIVLQTNLQFIRQANITHHSYLYFSLGKSTKFIRRHHYVFDFNIVSMLFYIYMYYVETVLEEVKFVDVIFSKKYNGVMLPNEKYRPFYERLR